MTITTKRHFLLAIAGLSWLCACAPSGGFKITPIPSDQSLREQIVERDPGWFSDRVALIEVSGILMNAHEPELFTEGEHPV